MSKKALVLLAGPDSVAAMHWALGSFNEVRALGFDYGQPHRDAELAASQEIASRRGVPWDRVHLVGMPRLDPSAGRDAGGVSRAFVPGRNGLFAWRAAAEAARFWPGQRVAIIMGCNADDAAGFPDCRPDFLAALNYNIGAGLAGACDVHLVTPWVSWLEPAKSMHKAAIVRWAANHPDPAVLEDVRYAVSCYRGTRCGQCDACTLRARAFAEAGVADGNEAPPKMHGGDPVREMR
jgi:7-cyano-7-deazaguanine synthase